MAQPLIPTTLSGFDEYIRRVIPYLLEEETPTNPRHERLNMTTGEMTTARNWRDQWWTGVVATPGAYELHSNAATKTKVTRTAVTTIMNGFTLFFSPILKRMSTIAYTDTDKETLNIPLRDTTLTPRPVIEVIPVVSIDSKAGARIDVRCRISTDASRASMHPDADAIEARYHIGTTPPANAAACTNMLTSGKALFTIDAGTDNEGMKFYLFCRYINVLDKQKNGAYSAVTVVTVLG